MSERKSYYSLDLAKFLCAIMIIVLHTSPFYSYSKVLSFGFRSIITVVAVPFFFTVSGFLFFVKINSLQSNEQNQYFFKYIKRLIIMYLIWSAIYFPFVIIEWMSDGISAVDVLQYIKEFFIKGSYSTIWFLPALMASISIAYFLSKRMQIEKIVLISIPFYVFACMGSSYLGLCEKIPFVKNVFDIYFSLFETIKNGLLFGFIYVALGGYFAKKKINISKVKCLLGIGMCWILLAVEAVSQAFLGWSKGGVDTKLFLIPLTIFVFLYVLSVNLSPNGKSFLMMRKLSLLMFLSQRIFLTLFELYLNETIFFTNSLLYCVCILVLTLLFSYVVIKISDRYKIFKYLY